MLNNQFTLPQHLHEVLIGYMLGDGGIFYATKNSTTPRFEFSMGQERLAFAEHIAKLFEEYATNSLKVIKVKATSSRNTNEFTKLQKAGNLLNSYRFKTKSLSVFKNYRDLFYKLNKKVVPQNIAELLTPLSLAYLIMSDGNYDSGRKKVRIYTNSYTKSDVELLANTIKTNFDISAKVMSDKKNQYIITIGALELTKLNKVVAQHMHSSMKYRIGM